MVALALLTPLLIFIAAATRLSAARREQRFAAMRLVGARPRQISVIAAVESTVAATAGVAAGFGLFFVLRVPLAAVPFTGEPFFPADLSLSMPDILLIAIGGPAAAAVVARLALRRVNRPRSASPAGSPRSRRGRGGAAAAGRPGRARLLRRARPTAVGSRADPALVPGSLLIVVGLVIAGPWLTIAGAWIMARHTSRPGALIVAAGWPTTRGLRSARSAAWS